MQKAFVLLTLLAALTVQGTEHFGQMDVDGPEFNVWVLADIQPRNKKERKDFTRAINDINKNVPNLHMAIAAGDMVDKAAVRKEENGKVIFREHPDVDWYFGERDQSYIKQWFELAGNHDVKYDGGKTFKQRFGVPFAYSYTINNVHFIMLGDEEHSGTQEISDETFEWFKNSVISNQDKNIIVASHAPLKGTGIRWIYTKKKYQVKRSKRFMKFLKKYPVTLWFSGHIHLPHYADRNFAMINGTTFMNVSSIRRDKHVVSRKPSESRVLSFKCGSHVVDIAARDHTKKKFRRDLASTVNLKFPFECR